MGHDWCKKMWTPFSACPVSRDFASTILKVANIHRILQKHCKDSLFAQDHACCTNSGTFHGMQTILQKPVCHARQKLTKKTRISHRVGCLWNPSTARFVRRLPLGAKELCSERTLSPVLPDGASKIPWPRRWLAEVMSSAKLYVRKTWRDTREKTHNLHSLRFFPKTKGTHVPWSNPAMMDALKIFTKS